MSKLGYRLAEILNAVPQGGGEYAARCPICKDSAKDHSKKRFLINVNTDKFICFNGGCDARGQRNEIIELLVKLDGGLNSDLILADKDKPSTPKSSGDKKLSPEAVLLIKKSIPYDRFPPLIKKNVLSDLMSRKVFTYDEIRQLRVVPGLVRKNWDWRVIIPVTPEIFQGKSTRKEKPKYLSPPGLDWFFDDDIPNASNCSVDEPIIITEGILDYHSLPPRNRSLTGGDKRFYNVDMLFYVKRFKDTVYALDSDLAGFVVLSKLYDYRYSLPNIRIFYPHWIRKDCKDLNDLLIKSVNSKDSLREMVLENTRSIFESYLTVKNIIERVKEEGKWKWKLKELMIPR